jgi:hypothetical protein
LPVRSLLMTLPDSAASLPLVQTGQFHGPLDMLLDEVRRQNVSIEKIAMAPIVARFLEYVRTATERNMNLDIEWLHMAATLIHWKSQSLLPTGVVGEIPADPIRDNLVQQLLGVQQGLAKMSEMFHIAILPAIRTDQTVNKAFRARKALLEHDPNGKAAQDYITAFEMITGLIEGTGTPTHVKTETTA